MRHGSARPKAENAPTPSYFEWRTEGNPLSIQISFAVIDQLESDIMKGFWSVPKRGAEVGGVLFGRIGAGERATVWIDDYEPVACEYRRGPSYVLSENDRKRLERTLRKEEGERQIVGYYRSHTRLGLYLDQDDFTLIQSYFADPRYVMLLVRPHASKTSVGGFFFWEEGTIHRQSTYLEFPFSTSEILKRLHGQGSEPQPQAAAAALAAHAQPPEPSPPPAARIAAREISKKRIQDLGRFMQPVFAAARAIRWRSMPALALLLLTLGFAEYQVIRVFARRTPPPGYLPALRIERNGSYLQVNWNRSAPSILNADRAILLITDGDYRKELHLDAGQLRDGSIAYSPSGNDISFRLELVGGRTTVSESLRVVEAPGVATAASAAPSRPSTKSRATPAASARPGQPLRARSQSREPAPKPQARIRRHGFFDDGL